MFQLSGFYCRSAHTQVIISMQNGVTLSMPGFRIRLRPKLKTQSPYRRSPKVGSPIASILKSNV